MKRQWWFVFYHGKKELAAVTKFGYFPGKINNMVQLLSMDHGIPTSQIEVKEEYR